MIGAYMDNQQASRAYSDAFRRLARMSGFDHKAVLKAEAGVILKTWAGRTKVGTVQTADRRSRLHTVRSLGYTQATDRGDVTVNAGFRPAPFGRVWIRVRNGGGRSSFILAKGKDFTDPTGTATFTLFGRKSFEKSGERSTSRKWMANVHDAQADVQAMLNIAIEKGRQALYLSRQSVVQIADSLGIDLSRVPGGGLSGAGLAKARAAMATTGRAYVNGSSQEGGDSVKAYVTLINRLPYGVKIGMDRILTGVVAGRAKYIETAYAKGAFNTQKRIIEAFPGLFYFRN